MSIPFERTRPATLPTYPRGEGKSTAYWGMMMLIFTEATFFLILFMSYVYLRFRAGVTWPPDGIHKPDLFKVSIMTPVLVLSSVPAYLADLGIRRGNLRRLRLGLMAAIVQGGTFIGLMSWEYIDLTKEFTPQTNAYGSLFYTITGFHGLHVFVGLCLLSWVLIYSFSGRWSAENHVAVQNVILYWHFVDAVWLFILTIIYFSPHWWP